MISAGIDFGTTNTVAAITNQSETIEPVLLEGKNSVIPTTVFFKEASPEILFGQSAISYYMDSNSGRFMRSLKRILGTSLMKTGTLINGKMIPFADIIGTFIKNAKEKIDSQSGQNVENVVMGRPVKFCDTSDDAQDKIAETELFNITKKSGFKNIVFQYEPIAAAFSHERNLNKECLAAVIDIGGGTSDFSIIRIGGKHKDKTNRNDDILANTGIRIGGNDFDKQLSLKMLMPEFGMGTKYHPIGKPESVLTVPMSPYYDLSEWSNVNNLYNYKTLNLIQKNFQTCFEPEKYGRLIEVVEKEIGHSILSAAENTKIELTSQPTKEIKLNFLTKPVHIFTTRKEFEESIAESVSKVCDSVKECLKQSGAKSNDIDMIILTGGSTEIPYVRETLCKYFPNAKISDLNKFSSVGFGLAYESKRLFA